MRSIKAQDRELELWYKRIKDGEIKLPRFQRHEAWDRNRITSLLNGVRNNFESVIVPIENQIGNLGIQNKILKEARDILLPRLMDRRIEV